MMRSSLKRQIEVRRSAGVSYSRRADARRVPQAAIDPEITRLIAASKAAMAEVDRATASGSPSSISAAKSELRNLMAKLEAARSDAVVKVVMGDALRAPVRLTRSPMAHLPGYTRCKICASEHRDRIDALQSLVGRLIVAWAIASGFTGPNV